MSFLFLCTAHSMLNNTTLLTSICETPSEHRHQRVAFSKPATMRRLESGGLSETNENTARSATSHILRNTWARHPDLFNEASNLNLTDLDCSYDPSRSALPFRPERGNAQQKKLRESMLEQWAGEIKQEFERSGEKFMVTIRNNSLHLLSSPLMKSLDF
jgi:hypothetical protein